MTTPANPHVLLCVAGLTPQVITETLYALAREGGDAVPDRIEIITTTEGQRRLQLSLLADHGGHGHLERLCRDHGLRRERLAFDADHIHVIRGADGQPLKDIVTEADNAAAADLIHERVRRLTETSRRLHVSLAGGRKTMGFYAGYSLSLYGRASDRLSHVLVNPPFESHPEFFYPPPEPVTLHLQGRNDVISTREADVRLADIPFVRLRDELDRNLPYEELPYSEAVERAQAMLRPPELVLELGTRRARFQGHPLTLSNTQFLWLVWLADRACRDEPPVTFDESALDELEAWVDDLEGTGPHALRDGIEKARQELARGERPGYFDTTKSRLNTAIEKDSGLPQRAAARYQIQTTGRRGRSGHYLDLTPEQIRFEGEP